MFKTLFAATALLVVAASPAFAKDEATRTFTRDGETYTYTAVTKGDQVLITGQRQSNGSTFELRVHGGHVTGVTGGVPVSFVVPNAQTPVSATELAAR